MLTITDAFDAQAGTYTLNVKQFCAPTPGQPEKQAFQIPLAIALLGPDGQRQPLRLADEAVAQDGTAPLTRVLELTADEQTFTFCDLTEAPVPSLLRGFSAPVILSYPYTDEKLAFLAAHDDDPFNRWESIQRLFVNAVLATLNGTPVARPSCPSSAKCLAMPRWMRPTRP